MMYLGRRKPNIDTSKHLWLWDRCYTRLSQVVQMQYNIITIISLKLLGTLLYCYAGDIKRHTSDSN